MVAPVRDVRQTGFLARLKAVGRALNGYNPDYNDYINRQLDEAKFDLLSAEVALENATLYVDMLRKRVARLEQKLGSESWF